MARPENPHFSLPFRFNSLSGLQLELAVSEQDTTDEIADCVELMLRTEAGERPTLPGWGRPQTLLFTTHHEQQRSMVQAAIDDSEPRVSGIVEGGVDRYDEGLLRLRAMYMLASEEER